MSELSRSMRAAYARSGSLMKLKVDQPPHRVLIDFHHERPTLLDTYNDYLAKCALLFGVRR